jgi:hypothetical protein
MGGEAPLPQLRSLSIREKSATALFDRGLVVWFHLLWVLKTSASAPGAKNEERGKKPAQLPWEFLEGQVGSLLSVETEYRTTSLSVRRDMAIIALG